jgi:hypothetical protein
MVRIQKLDCLRVAIVERKPLWCFCIGCGHVKAVDPRDWMHRFGRDLTFADLQRRLKCLSCERKLCLIIPAADPWPRRD